LFRSLKRLLNHDDLAGCGQHEGPDVDGHIEAAFQLATLSGPLCAEPVEGLAYFVESLEVDAEGLEKETGQSATVSLRSMLTGSRAEYNLASYWVFDIGRKRGMQERAT
jgi:hypothetical protein